MATPSRHETGSIAFQKSIANIRAGWNRLMPRGLDVFLVRQEQEYFETLIIAKCQNFAVGG
jgi:hypothetical protein